MYIETLNTQIYNYSKVILEDNNMNSDLREHLLEEDLALALEEADTREDKERIRYAFLKHNCLCRYIDIGNKNTTRRTNIISALAKDRLYLSPNKNYNDVFDTMMFVDFDTLKTEIETAINLCMPLYAETIRPEDPLKAFVAITKFNNNKKEENKLLDEYLNTIEQFIDEVKVQIREGVKSVCLSENFNSAIMWSHYANDCQGISLLYDKKELVEAYCYTEKDEEIDLKFELKEIIYQDYRYDATRDFSEMVKSRESSLSHKAVKNIILTKSRDWSYEQEVRLIPRKLDYINGTEAMYLSIRPKAIIFGKDIAEKDRQEIINAVNGKGILLYESWLNNNQKGYEVVVQRWYP